MTSGDKEIFIVIDKKNTYFEYKELTEEQSGVNRGACGSVRRARTASERPTFNQLNLVHRHSSLKYILHRRADAPLIHLILNDRSTVTHRIATYDSFHCKHRNNIACNLALLLSKFIAAGRLDLLFTAPRNVSERSAVPASRL